MNRLTKELTALSNLLVTAPGVESTVLDFNLARRSGVVINRIDSLMNIDVAAGDITIDAAQEVDLDPDNTDVWTGAVLLADNLDMDSSRLIRHRFQSISRNGTAEAVTYPQAWMWHDYTNLALEERPLSITNLRHHLRLVQTIGSGDINGLVIVTYVIVELTLQELGIVNAGRR
ncbi:hypothetical protein LCGC14_2057050 [marine sediment metagenome]|uniref:Uncharacterized protein n=1 Tax=marine sediment metagenome TaxID=412755 RepID=A0A0F9F9Q3_9ZZZZ